MGDLLFPSQEGRRLEWKIVGARRKCSKDWEISSNVGMEQLEDPLRAEQIPQGMLTQITETSSWREAVPSQILGRQ